MPFADDTHEFEVVEPTGLARPTATEIEELQFVALAMEQHHQCSVFGSMMKLRALPS